VQTEIQQQRPAPVKKRTNVRFKRVMGKLAFRVLSVVAPSVAEKRAFELFGRPYRRNGPPPAPQVPGLPARPSHLPAGRNQIALWSWGDDDDGGGAAKPLVVLAHGWNGAAAQLSSFVPPFLQAGYRVIAFDQPAHGHSTGRRVTIIDLREALLAIARVHGPIHAVVAHSLGASATVLAVGAGLAVGRLALVAPPAEMPSFARAFATQLGLPPARVRGVLEHARRAVGGDLEALDLRNLARRMTVPMMLVHSPDDPDVRYAESQAIVAAWPGARLETVPDLGHSRPLRDPQVIASVVDFVSDSRRG
jgi:pimeloyl-ACP methyl ester carboxylesterase